MIGSALDRLGAAATAALVLAAERWPEFRDLQAILGPAFTEYQRAKLTYVVFSGESHGASEPSKVC